MTALHFLKKGRV